MAQGNPETFPKGNSNLNKTIRNVAVAGGTAGSVSYTHLDVYKRQD